MVDAITPIGNDSNTIVPKAVIQRSIFMIEAIDDQYLLIAPASVVVKHTGGPGSGCSSTNAATEVMAKTGRIAAPTSSRHWPHGDADLRYLLIQRAHRCIAVRVSAA